MKKVKTGWVAQTDNARGFTVEGETPSGVYVYYGLTTISLHHAGLDKADPRGLTLPGDPHLLHDLAKCLRAAARQIEQDRGLA